MATRKKSTRKQKPAQNPLQSIAEALLRPGFIGSVLVLAAVFTILSLVSGSNGSLTGAWVSWLRSAFGVGVWALPIVMGMVGLWLVISALEQMPAPAWRRPIGILVLFIGMITAISLMLPPEVRVQLEAGEAGGWVGTEIADLLQTTISLVGAWAFVAFLLVAGVIFLTDRMLIDGTLDLVDAIQGAVWGRRNGRADRGYVNPAVPLASGEVSLWNRMRDRFRRTPEAPYTLTDAPLPSSERLVRPEGAATLRQVVGRPEEAPAPRPQAAAHQAAAEVHSGSAAQPAAAPARASDSSVLQPRIIGAAQEWRLPRMGDMLDDWERRTDSDDEIRRQGKLIQETLELFGVPATFEGAYKGPSVTQYLIKPGYVERPVRSASKVDPRTDVKGDENGSPKGRGANRKENGDEAEGAKGEVIRTKVKVAKIAALANDLALALAAPSVRIEAPIPGTNYVGIEVPNHESNVVGLKELMESETFTIMKGRLKFALGEDVKGQAVVADLARMPHLLIAGATGSGKSVCINSIIAGLLLSHTPDTLRLLMVDPKMVELSVYNGVPHLLSPVVTEVDKAAGVLFWAVKEMERRYSLFAKSGARDLIRYNEYLVKKNEKALPYIVVVVDEMADLMLAAPEEVEKHICRLAQMARATGIHLIIATQRPSVDVITGLIKANFPARIAFAVTSQVDSRVILDIPGAERLLGRGDMLFMAPDASKLERLQGTFLSDEEINRVVRYWKGVRVLDSAPSSTWEQGQLPIAQEPPASSTALPPSAAQPASVRAASSAAAAEPPLFEQIEALKAVDGRDDLFDEAAKVVREAGRGSVSLLQRKLRIGYGRAARLIEQLEDAGILGPDAGGSQGRPLASSEGSPWSQPAAPAEPQTRPGVLKPRIIGDDSSPSDSPPGVWM